MDNFVFQKYASIYATDRFFAIGTQSGYRDTRGDPNQPIHYFLPSASDVDLGTALRTALLKSRRISEAELGTFYDPETINRDYEQWVADLLARSSYGSRRSMFAHLKLCNVELANGTIKIGPTKHEQLEGWGRERDDGIEDVFVAESASDAELGSGIRLALSRCTGK